MSLFSRKYYKWTSLRTKLIHFCTTVLYWLFIKTWFHVDLDLTYIAGIPNGLTIDLTTKKIHINLALRRLWYPYFLAEWSAYNNLMVCYMFEYGLMSTELMLFPSVYSRQQSMSNKLVQSLAKIYSWLTNLHTFAYIFNNFWSFSSFSRRGVAVDG